MAARWVAGLVLTLVLAGCGSKDSPTGVQLGERTVSVAQTVKVPEVVDALFLGSGPLIPRDGLTDCAISGVWSGFPRGTAVRLQVSGSVPVAAQTAIQRGAAQVEVATLGGLSATVTLTGAPGLLPGPGEVVVSGSSDPRGDGCPTAAGCVLPTFAGRGVFGSVRVVEPTGLATNGWVQEAVGQGVLGLCHIDGKLIGGASLSLMSGGPGVQAGQNAPGLTALDLSAIQSVYASSLQPGAVRRQFLQAGLVNLQIGEQRVRR